MKKMIYLLCVATLIGIYMQDEITFITPMTNKVIGIGLGLLMLAVWWNNSRIVTKIIKSKEIWMWILFLFWSLATGSFIAVNQRAMFGMFLFLVQLTVLILSIITIIIWDKDVKKALYINIIIFITYLFYLGATGQMNAVFYSAYQSDLRLGHLRNANELGFMGLGAVMSWFALMYYKGKRENKVISLINYLFIVYAIYFILQTGSRKSAIVLLLFLGLWYILCSLPITIEQKGKKGVLIVVATIVVSIIALSFIIPWVFENTYFGTRLALLETGEDGSALARIIMYKEAIIFFEESPIWGLGLDQFKYHSITGAYSHSEYAEIIACTGIFGTIFYYSIYLIISIKLWRIRKRSDRTNMTWYMAGCFLAMLTARFCINFGVVGFTSISHWLIISPILGFVIQFYSFNNQISRNPKIIKV